MIQDSMRPKVFAAIQRLKTPPSRVSFEDFESELRKELGDEAGNLIEFFRGSLIGEGLLRFKRSIRPSGIEKKPEMERPRTKGDPVDWLNTAPNDELTDHRDGLGGFVGQAVIEARTIFGPVGQIEQMEIGIQRVRANSEGIGASFRIQMRRLFHLPHHNPQDHVLESPSSDLISRLET